MRNGVEGETYILVNKGISKHCQQISYQFMASNGKLGQGKNNTFHARLDDGMLNRPLLM